MQKYIEHFTTRSDRIKINETDDICILLIESAVMITDHSSVAMDFANMRKPIIFYQFDKKKSRKLKQK